VAGCVATAMGQIMKYWNYPPHGIGSSSYMDSPFGTLYADFDSTQYDWSQMPLNVTRTNSSVATLMYDCGVGVQMAYSDTSSGSYIITGDDPVCAQSAFVQYFGYSGASIQGLYRQNYSDNDWTTLLEDELNNKRPFLYAGSGNQGSHAWVCDGYDATGYFHMNWGWAGYEDGYFSLDALNPDNIPLNSDEEALIGIGPSPAVADFNGNNLVIRAGDSVKFIDNSMGYVPLTSWNWSFNGTEAIYSTAQNPVVIYNEIGTFNVSETVTGSEGSNTLTRNSYITVLENNPVNVYPTLNDGTFTIQLHDPSLATSNLEFALYDMLGRKIYATALVQYSTQITLNVPHGMYFFRAFDISGKSVSTGKLAIK
jgi:PKD repeat protein